MQGKRAWAEIDMDALAHNVKTIGGLIKKGEFMAVVKADAYGHGAAVLAPALEKMGINYFAVSNIEEAEELRGAGVVGDILILGYTDVGLCIELFEQNIAQTVFSASYAKSLNQAAKKVGVKLAVHIKIDSGMGRLGFNCRSDDSILAAADEISEICRLPNLIVKGIFTHFASADSDEPDDVNYTENQYRLFMKAVEAVTAKTGKNLIVHCCNSAGTLLHQNMHQHLNRVGISMYGLTPDPQLLLPVKLQPVMSFKTVVSQLKTIKSGDYISYGRTFRAERDMIVATLPVGYADGYPRLLSNVGHVLIAGKKAPVLGRVCMDQIMVDATGINLREGDTAVLFGEGLPVELLAEQTGTINYEIVCGISRRVPRIYTKNGKIARIENYLLG